MSANIENIVVEAKNAFSNCTNQQELLQEKANFLGKKGPIAQIMSTMRDLSIEEKKALGASVNVAKSEIEASFEENKARIINAEIEAKIASEAIDVTLPAKELASGSIHPLTQTIRELEDLFIGMGYEVVTGPEVEEDVYNFELLNLPQDHPAREMQDSFYIDPVHLLRTHTSPVQARTMLARDGKPIKIICPGKVYRRDPDDATHSHQFMQCEGLVIGEDISIADLKGNLLAVANKMFGEGRKIRLRPSYFPFTEPSVEVDVTCAKCDGVGCPMCKGTGYIEVLGAGMVNRNVLRMCGYDDNLQGFAFGIGIERVAILKNRIEDIRNFYTNDVRFLSQFKKLK